MTPDLHTRLDSSMPPFDGSCVRNNDELTLGQLREILTAVIAKLSSKYPTIESFHDWHEHDGFIVKSKSESWETFGLVIQTDRALFDSRAGDVDVRIALYPNSNDWLLRYNVDENGESEYDSATCDFDLSIAKNSETSDVNEFLLSHFPNLVVEHDARAWFKSNYGG